MIYKAKVDFTTGIVYDTTDTKIAKLNTLGMPTDKSPFRKVTFKFDKETINLCYGGFINGTFVECCQTPCRWGKNCFMYGKKICRKNQNLEELDYYLVSEDEQVVNSN